MSGVLVTAVSAFFSLLILAIVVRALLTWVRPRAYSRWFHEFERALETFTEPVLAPIRRFVPPVGPGIDFSPLVAVILLDLVRTLAIELLLRVQ